MKKGKKLLRMTALVGCILLGGGILLSGAGYVGMGFSLKAFTHPQVEKAVRETVCYKDAPQCVEVYAPMGDVIIQGDENAEEPEITAASSVYEVTMQFGALVVQPNEEYRSGSWTTWDWYRLLNLQPWGDYDVTITLPKRMMDSVKATSQLGDVSLSNLWVENVSAQASCGSVSASQLTQTDAVKVSSSLGDVTMQGCSGKYLDLDSDLGNVQVDDCLFDNGDLAGSSGDIQMADSTWTWLTVQNDMGNCVLKGVTAQTSVTCGTSLGNVELEKLTSPEIHLSADSGNVTGSVAGKQEVYRISQEVDMGESNLEDQLNGVYLLEVAASLGDIQLEFTE